MNHSISDNNLMLNRLTVVMCLILGCLSFSNLHASQKTAILEIDVYGTKNEVGELSIALYNSADNWLKNDPDKIVAKQSLPADQHVHAIFEDLPYGQYAIAVIHDENGNHKMDMSWLPVPHPEEGYGFSNDALPQMGPPKYADAVFKIKTPKVSKKILIHYSN